MTPLPTPQAIARRRRRRRTLLAGALTSVLVAAACGGAMNFSQDARFSVDTGITDGLDPLTRGKRHFANRNFGLAIEAFEEARDIDPRSVNVLNALAVAYEEIGRSDIADSYFLEALDVDPSSAQTYNNWAMVHLGRGNPVRAEALLAEAARLAPGDAMVAENLARVDASHAGDSSAAAAEPTGSLTTVIAELQPTPENWAPTIRTVAPHVHFLETQPPAGAPAAVAAADGSVPTVLYPQVAAANVLPLPDPSIEQAPPPPAIPVGPVVEFDLDDPVAANAALISLAAAEAGRSIVPVGVSSAETEASNGRIVRPGAAASVTVVADADAEAALAAATMTASVPDAYPTFGPNAVIVSAELKPANVDAPVAVGVWPDRPDATAVADARDGGTGEFVTVASTPADARLVTPGAGPENAPAGAKPVGVGETVEPTVDPRRVVVPVHEMELASTTAPDGPAVADWTVEPRAIASLSAESMPVRVESPREVARDGVADAPTLLAAAALENSLAVAMVMPPAHPEAPAVADASARVPLVVAVLAASEPVAPESALADNRGNASLPLASTARIPSVVAVLAMVGAEGGNEGFDATNGTQD